MLKNTKQFFTAKRIWSLLGIALVIAISQIASASAQTITQGYASDESIQRATIVSLVQDDAKKVEPTTLESQVRMHGVVVDANDAPFTLSTEEEKTFVATKGRFEAFVSNENGVIQSGDYITISRVAGIGMKAGDLQPFVVGKAVSGFDGENAVLSTTEITDNGEQKLISIGRIQIDVGVAGNPLLRPQEADLPGFLQRVAESIAQKTPINPVRIYISLTVLIVSAIVAGTLLYSGVRSGIISIGRNPLSKKSIIRSLLQVVFTSLIILLVGIFGVYLILRV